MKKKHTIVKRLLTGVLSLVMVFTSVNLPSLTTTVNAATQYGNNTSLSILAGNTGLNLYKLTNSDNGATLNNGIYYLTGDVTLNEDRSKDNALKIADNATTYIYIPSGMTLEVYGKDGTNATDGGSATIGKVEQGSAYTFTGSGGGKMYNAYDPSITKQSTNGNGGNGATAGCAAIFVPQNANLIIMGNGTLKAYGGKGGDAGAAGNGANTYMGMFSAKVSDGGWYGTVTTATIMSQTNITPNGDNGTCWEFFSAAIGAGGGGAGGAAGGGAGIGTNGTNGSNGTNGVTNQVGNESDSGASTNAQNAPSVAEANTAGNIYIAVDNDITGGQGGEAGTDKSETPKNTVTFYSYYDEKTDSAWITHGQPGGAGAAGGNGAAIGQGGQGGTGGQGGQAGSIQTDYKEHSGYAGTSSRGTSGAAGSAGTENTSTVLDGSNYPYNSIEFNDTDGTTLVTQEYYLTQTDSITVPAYTGTLATNQTFVGWQLDTAASVLPSAMGGDSSNPLLTKDNTFYQKDNTISTKGIYGDVKLKAKVVEHTHSFTYKSDGAVVKAYCTEDENHDYCSYYGESNAITLTLSAEDAIYTGSVYAGASVENNITSVTEDTASDISYVGKDGTVYTESTNAPANVGKYTASVTIGGKTAKKDFEITKKQITKPTEDTSTFTYNESLQKYVLATNSDYTIANDTRTNAGTQKVKVTLRDKANTCWTDDTDTDLEFTFTIHKANQSGITVDISDYNFGTEKSAGHLGTIQDGASIKYYYSTKNEAVNGTEWTTAIAKDLNPGTYYMYAVVAETNNYNKFVTPVVSFEVIGLDMSSSVTASGVTKTYDGNSYTITVTKPEGATVKYGTSEDDCTLTAAPTYKDAGEYTVYYSVTKRGHNPVTGFKKVIINKREITSVTGIEVKDKKHDGKTAVTIDTSKAVLVGKVDGDNLTIKVAGEYADAAIGNDKIVNVSTKKLVGDTKNYTLADNAVPELKGNIIGFTVTFDVNGGIGSIAPATGLEKNATVTVPTAPTKEGYRFIGWFTDKTNAKSDYDFAIPVTSDFTLYAHWDEIKKDSHEITGTVTEGGSITEGGRAVSNVKVELRKGLTLVATTNTNAAGEYGFYNVVPDEYNVVAITSNKTKTEKAVIKTTTTEVNITLPTESVSSVLKVDEDSILNNTSVDPAHIVVGGLDEEAASRAKAGKDVKVEQIVKEVEVDSPDVATEVAEIKKLPEAKNKTLEVLDIVFKSYENGVFVEDIKNTNVVQELIVPYNATGKENIVIFRNHVTDEATGASTTIAFTKLSARPTRGDANFKDGMYYIDATDPANAVIYIYADQFSVYSVGYETPKSSDDSGSTSDNGDSSDDNKKPDSTPANTDKTPSPKTRSPKTGDDFDPRTWAYLMIFGLAGILGLGVYQKKKRKENE